MQGCYWANTPQQAAFRRPRSNTRLNWPVFCSSISPHQRLPPEFEFTTKTTQANQWSNNYEDLRLYSGQNQSAKNEEHKQSAYRELFVVRPRSFGKFFNRNPALIVLFLETGLVNEIGSFITAFRDNIIGAEVVSRRLEVGEGELNKRRHAFIGRRGFYSILVVALLVLRIVLAMAIGSRFFQVKKRLAAAHNAVDTTISANSSSISPSEIKTRSGRLRERAV